MPTIDEPHFTPVHVDANHLAASAGVPEEVPHCSASKWAHLRMIRDLLLLFLPHVKRCESPYLFKAVDIFF